VSGNEARSLNLKNKMKQEVEEKNGGKQPLNPGPEAENAKGKKKGYAVQVNDFNLAFYNPIVTAREIIKEAGFEPVECYILYQKFKDCDFARIPPDEKIDLTNPGIEKFVVKVTDIFHYTIDNEPETSETKFMTAKEILEAAGLDPKDHYLVEIFPNQGQKSYKDHPDESIELRCPGNKFISVFKGEVPVS
jgi:hypothetical protein